MEFHGDAICLSGIAGTFLKSQIIGQYYRFWWQITSGGPRGGYRIPTAIIELNAATGEIYIEEKDSVILGSAGHALQLKEELDNPNNLKIVLIETDSDCYYHLKNVIRTRFDTFPVEICEGPIDRNTTNVFLFNLDLDQALREIEKMKLGLSIFFFDPLRMIKWSAIENVARNRISTYYETGTEFIIFLFTSDYFIGRNDFTAFPTHQNEKDWSDEERASVEEADLLFGDQSWRIPILNSDPLANREWHFIWAYKNKLHKWFRYVLPLPFNPKGEQIYHLIVCSNFEAGIRQTRDQYRSLMQIPKYQPDNKLAYRNFKGKHPGISSRYTGKSKPIEWKILWKIIKQEAGIRDMNCSDFSKDEPDPTNRKNALLWLCDHGYLNEVDFETAWSNDIAKYCLNWRVVEERLEIHIPPQLIPISPQNITIMGSSEK